MSKQRKPNMALLTTYEVRWKNFKGFKDTDWKKIKPITVIIGSNNSGKSSFISPLLIMNQTIQSLDSTTPLIISGKTYEAGSVRELFHNFDLKKEIFFGFRYYHRYPKVDISKEKQKYPPGSVEIKFAVNNIYDRELFVKQFTIFDWLYRPLIKYTRTKNGYYKVTGIDEKKLSKEEKEALRKSKPVNFLFSPNSLIYQYSEQIKKNKKQLNVKRKLSEPFSEILKVISTNFTLMRDILGELGYIGPIREKPQRYYILKNQNFNTVGIGGENVPDIIKKNPNIKPQLNKWIKDFNFGDSLELKPLSKNLCAIHFKTKRKSIYSNIANAGFGASQILPLIVQALISERESLTLAEQPEIHLNPKLQGVLAELFCFMAKKDQRIIVETHSEHLLMRLRRLIAEKKLTPNDIALYFVEKVNGESEVNEIKIEEDGSIKLEEWPKDFFDEALIEAMALSSAQQKSRTK